MSNGYTACIIQVLGVTFVRGGTDDIREIWT